MPGGLWDTSAEIYGPLGATPRQGDLKWTFEPFGNTIQFKHLEHEQNKNDWQGSQVTYFGFDELTHFTESAVTYLIFSRGRSGCAIDSYTRCTCNPDPGWVKRFIAPWVDREFDGGRAASGEVRHFIRSEGAMEWVPRSHPDAKSLAFIRASVYDNPIMLAANPRYIPSLKALLPVERARLLDGDWDVRREGLVYSGFEDCIVEAGRDSDPSIGGIDFGFNNPFAAVWGHVDDDDVLWITGCRYARQTTLPVHSEALPKGVRYWCDPAGASDIRELRNAGHDVIACVHKGTMGLAGSPRKPVLSGIDRVSERMRTGRLKILRQACLPLVHELSTYHYDPEKRSEDPVKEDDHLCDALRYLVVGLDRGRAVPSHVEDETPEQIEARVRAEVEAEYQAKLDADLRAQGDASDERWWSS